MTSAESEPTAPVRILTVCIGNVCRSPLAERLLSHHLATAVADGSVRVHSAGVRGMVGHAMERNAAAELQRLGGDPAGFAARRAEAEVIADADLVLAMTQDVRAQVLQEYPRAMRRTFTLPEFAALCQVVADRGPEVSTPAELVAAAARLRSQAAGIEQDVPDPIGRSAEVHRQVADLIADRVGVVVDALRPLI